MIEALSAAVSSAPSVRAIAAQVTSAESYAANPVKVQKASLSAAYLSPHVRLSPDVKPIFVVRDSSTGEAIRQYPTEAQLRAYARAQEVRADAIEDSMTETVSTSSQDAAVIVKTSVEFTQARKEIRQAEAAPVPAQIDAPAPDVKAAVSTVSSAPAAPVKTGDTFSADI